MKVRLRVDKKTKAAKSMQALLSMCGWTVREGKHSIWYCPCGKHIVTVAKTPRRNGCETSLAQAKKCQSVSQRIVS